MQKVKFTAMSALIVNTAPGVEVEAILHEGVIYVPAFSMDSSAVPVKEAPVSGKAVPATSAPTKAPAKAAEKSSGLPSLAQMKEMTLPELVTLAKDNGIDLDALKAEHKVARWSNVTLSKALDSAFADMSGAADEPEEDDDVPEERPAKGAATGRDPKKVQFLRILKELDSQDIPEEDAIRQLGTLLDDDDVAERIVASFMEDATAQSESVYAAYVAGEFDEAKPAAKGAAKPAAKGAAKPAAKMTAKPGGKAAPATVKPEDLEEGQRVEVYWDEHEDWFPGEVSAFDDEGNPIISYDDGTEETYDPEVCSKIRLEK